MTTRSFGMGNFSALLGGTERNTTTGTTVTKEKKEEKEDSYALLAASNVIMSQRKGLSNDLGENNCFLNVIIQSLWHIRSFRILITTGDHAVHHGKKHQSSRSRTKSVVDTKGNTPSGCLLCELERIFVLYQYAEDPVLVVDRVRTALSAVFEIGEMNDATETLEAILDTLHLDTFHRMMALRQEEEEEDSLEASMDLAHELSCEPQCVAHLLFQMNLMEMKTCRQCGETSEPLMNTDFLYRVYAQELLSHSDENKKTLEEVFHMEAQGFSTPNFFSCDACHQANCMALSRWMLSIPMVFAVSVIWSSDQVNKQQVKDWMTLLSSQNPSATGRTIENDRFTIDLSRVFCIIENKTNSEVEEQSFEYVFRGMVCYYGRHYVGFFASRSIEQDGKEMERWFLFDDTRVKRVGTWEEVRSRIERGGYQPTLLFYEKKDLARKKLEQLATDIHTWWKVTAEDKQNKPSSSTTTTKETVIEMNHPTISPSKNNCTLANSPSKLISSSEDDVVVPPPTSSVRRSQMYGDDNILNMHEQSVRDMISRLDGLISNKSGLDTRISLGNSIALGSSMSIGSTGSMMLGSTNAPPGSFRRVSRSRRRESLRLQPPSSNTGTIQEVDVNPDDIFGDDSEASIQVVKLSKPQLSSPRQPMTGKKEPTKEKNVVISIKTFEVELNAADGGIGLVLEDGNNEMIRSFIRGRTSRDGRGSAFVVVKGFETNGAGQKLPAQASGQIQLGDLLIRVNENELTSNAYEALELIFMSENPVRLVFQRILPWECPKCTLLNEFTTSTCGVCTFQVDLPYQLSNTT